MYELIHDNACFKVKCCQKIIVDIKFKRESSSNGADLKHIELKTNNLYFVDSSVFSQHLMTVCFCIL